MTTPCMDKIPILPLKAEDVPETIDDATILALVQSFVILTAYTATQYQKCASDK